MIIDPADGKLPWTEAHKNDQAALRRTMFSLFDNPEDRPPPERCLASTASPPLVPTLDNNLFHIIQTPDVIALVSELIEINYKFTVTDPTLYARPWSGETHILKSSQRMFEYACHEGNYSVRGVLQAARDAEAAAKP